MGFEWGVVEILVGPPMPLWMRCGMGWSGVGVGRERGGVLGSGRSRVEAGAWRSAERDHEWAQSGWWGGAGGGGTDSVKLRCQWNLEMGLRNRVDE